MTGGDDRWDDPQHRAMVTRTAELVAQLCLAYGVPVRRLSVADLKAGHEGICGHVDVAQAFRQSSHWDPGPGFPWKRFMGQVETFVAQMQGQKPLTGKPPTLWLQGARKPRWTRELKHLLNASGDVGRLHETGTFDKDLRAALVRYRRLHKIRPYRPGVAGSKVWRSLGWRW